MMQVEILSQIHFIVTLIFGIILTASFLGVHKQKKALFKLGLFTVISTILQQLVYNHYANLDSLEYFLRFYPFYIHLPLIVFFSAGLSYTLLQYDHCCHHCLCLLSNHQMVGLCGRAFYSRPMVLLSGAHRPGATGFSAHNPLCEPLCGRAATSSLERGGYFQHPAHDLLFL